MNKLLKENGIDRNSSIVPLSHFLENLHIKKAYVNTAVPGNGKSYSSVNVIPAVLTVSKEKFNNNNMMFCLTAPNVDVISSMRSELSKQGGVIERLKKENTVIILDNSTKFNEVYRDRGAIVMNKPSSDMVGIIKQIEKVVIICVGTTSLFFDRYNTNQNTKMLYELSKLFPSYIVIDEGHNSFGSTTKEWYTYTENGTANFSTKRQRSKRKIKWTNELYLSGTPSAEQLYEAKDNEHFEILPSHNADNLGHLRVVNNIKSVDQFEINSIQQILKFNKVKSKKHNSKETSMVFIDNTKMSSIYKKLQNSTKLKKICDNNVLFYNSEIGLNDMNGKLSDDLFHSRELLMDPKSKYNVLLLVQAGSQGFDVPSVSTVYELRKSGKIYNVTMTTQRIFRGIRKHSAAPLDVFIRNDNTSMWKKSVIDNIHNSYNGTDEFSKSKWSKFYSNNT